MKTTAWILFELITHSSAWPDLTRFFCCYADILFTLTGPHVSRRSVRCMRQLSFPRSSRAPLQQRHLPVCVSWHTVTQSLRIFRRGNFFFFLLFFNLFGFVRGRANTLRPHEVCGLLYVHVACAHVADGLSPASCWAERLDTVPSATRPGVRKPTQEHTWPGCVRQHSPHPPGHTPALLMQKGEKLLRPREFLRAPFHNLFPSLIRTADKKLWRLPPPFLPPSP